jgi:hypothetical protein
MKSDNGSGMGKWREAAIFGAAARIFRYSFKASSSGDASRVLAADLQRRASCWLMSGQADADTFFRADDPGRQTFGDARIHRTSTRGLSLQGSCWRPVTP